MQVLLRMLYTTVFLTQLSDSVNQLSDSGIQLSDSANQLSEKDST